MPATSRTALRVRGVRTSKARSRTTRPRSARREEPRRPTIHTPARGAVAPDKATSGGVGRAFSISRTYALPLCSASAPRIRSALPHAANGRPDVVTQSVTARLRPRTGTGGGNHSIDQSPQATIMLSMGEISLSGPRPATALWRVAGVERQGPEAAVAFLQTTAKIPVAVESRRSRTWSLLPAPASASTVTPVC